MKIEFKKSILPHLLAVSAILIFSIILFIPSLNGSRIVGPDSISSNARYKYIRDYKDDTGKTARWNPSQFAGDPRVMAIGKEYNFLGIIHRGFTLNYAVPIGMFFCIGIALYLSLCLMGVNNWLSLTLSLAYMLSYTFFTLYEAGHGQKVLTLAYAPLVISGSIMLMGARKWKGIIALLIGTSLAIYVGHVQMVYYMILGLTAFSIPLLIFAILEKEIKPFMQGVVIALGVALLAVATDYSQLKVSFDFSKQTMRGGRILPEENPTEEKDAGLKWDYAMSWSYEAKEFLTILSPRLVGGGSQEKVDKENPIAKLMMQNGSAVENGKVSIPGYWGNMPFTSGGVYIGAGIGLLFILSFFFIERKYVTAFLSAFFIIFLLSLGSNAAWFNRLLFDYLPMFSKFRAPSSVVSVLPAFIIIQVGMGINTMIENKDKKDVKKLIISAAIGIGILLLIMMIGSASFSFLSPNDANYPFNIQSILIEGRKAMFNADIMRSITFMAIVTVLIFLYMNNIVKSKYLLYVLMALVLIADLLPVGKRLITDDDFMPIGLYENQFAPRPSDIEISQLEPNGRGFYRVLDLSVNTFNDAKPCYYHNQIGGYSAVKMQRYQDIIERQISKNNMEVINMLNAKYFVSKEGQVQTNPNANGNAWFVSDVKSVSTDLEEMQALDEISSKKTAIIKSDEFGEILAGNGEGSIVLKSFGPDKMVYQSNSSSKQLAVFSETYYGGKTGWVATIDGQEIDILRANYILRAIEVPSGNHEIIMEFKPVASGRVISSVASVLSWLLLIIVIGKLLGFIKIGASENPAIEKD